MDGIAKRLSIAEEALGAAGLLNLPGLKNAGLVTTEGKLTDLAKKIIMEGHQAGGGVYEDLPSVREKARTTKSLPKEWRRELMQRGIMGGESQAEVLKINLEADQILKLLNSGVDLDKILAKVPGKVITQPILNALLVDGRESYAKSPTELRAFLKEYDMTEFSGNTENMFRIA